MTTLTISLKDLNLGGEGAAALPPDQAIDRIAEAQKTFDRAVRVAQRGEYTRAIPLFQQVLEVLPAHVDARRNLAMAFLESGDKEQAIDYLLQALMLAPRDAWSHLLLANIYFKHEHNLDRADHLFRSALEISPNDPIILTSYGVLMAKRGNAEQATEFFERAIQANPAYPNSCHGLALSQVQDGKPAEALLTLDVLFGTASSADIRSMSPRLIWQANVTLNAAYALFGFLRDNPELFPGWQEL